jgi:hypothetical protein
MKLPRSVQQHRISSPKSNIFSEKFDFAVSLCSLKGQCEKAWGFKIKWQKKQKKLTIQSSAVQKAYGEAVWRRKRGGGRKSC